MNWFYIALIGPIIWAAENYIDKYLLQKYFKEGGVGGLLIFSSLISLLILPFIFMFAPDVLAISNFNKIIIIFESVLSIFAFLLYLYALEKEETSMVVPIFQTIPMFFLILGFIFLGEVISGRQLFGILLIISAAVALSLELAEKVRLKSNILFLMLAASFLIAASGTIFKFVAIEAGFWATSFWNYVGFALMGIIFLMFVKKYRDEFFKVFEKGSKGIFALNLLNEILDVGAGLIFRFATLLAPIALVQAVNGFQPFFVFFYGSLITLLFPGIIKENLTKRHIAHKLISIIVLFIGTYLIAV